MTTRTERILWGTDQGEVLIYSDPDEAIEAYLDFCHPTEFEEIGTVRVYEYKPMTPSLADCGSPLENVLEYLEEQYGNPDGSDHEVTETMKTAERDFLTAILAEYQPRMCEQTGKTITVNALEWVREHRPDWLKSESK